jgi:hypothetical protein
MLFKPLGDGYSLLCSQKTDSAAHWGKILSPVCRGSCFLATQQRIAITKRLEKHQKSAVSRGENTSKKTGQMSSKFREIIKKLISVFGEKPARGLPKPPPTPPRLDSAEFTNGENAISGCGRGIHPPN